METVQQDILVDIEPQLVQASTGKRLANYLIDFIVFLLLIVIVVTIMNAASPSRLNEDGSGLFSDNSLIERLFWTFMYALYMGFIETIFKGRSIGKFITGTKAVNEDGSSVTFPTAMARGFSRVVPFEPFSALGGPSYPWHDKWNKTYVIDIKNSSLSN